MMARSSHSDRPGLRRAGRLATAAVVAVAGVGVLSPMAMAAEPVPATLSDLRTTAKQYAHLFPEGRREMAQRMGRLVLGELTAAATESESPVQAAAQ